MNNTHDQNFKNLILDYPVQAIQFFAPLATEDVSRSVKITPIRQEQLKRKLGDRYRELDTPLMVEWPNSDKKALLFLMEEESKTSLFSIERLAHYCLDIHELYQTDHLVPVVIFLKGGLYQPVLKLGTDQHTFLNFYFIACELSSMDASKYLESDNIVARLNLPLMCYNKKQRIEVYARSLEGLTSLEPDLNQQAKYIDYIDQYANLSDEEQVQYQVTYLSNQSEGDKIMGLAQLLRDEGKEEGRQEGRQEGIDKEKVLLLRQICRRYGDQVGFQVQSIINTIQSSEKLEMIADLIIDCTNGDEFSEKLALIGTE